MAIVKRVYDTRAREIIARTGNADLIPELEIPRGTRATWVRRGPREVVGRDERSTSRQGNATASPNSSGEYA